MCQSKADGGKRCQSGLKQKSAKSFGPKDMAWLQTEESRQENTPSVLYADNDPEYVTAALNLLLAAKEDEPVVTAELKTILPDGWELAGLDERIKSPESTVRSVKKGVEGGDREPLETVITNFHDALRYTMVAPHDIEFANTIKTTLTQLHDDGYTIRKMPNYFLPNNRYMGFHSQQNGNIIPFEIQFHTQVTYAIKKQTDATYHILREQAHTLEEEIAVNKRMAQMYNQVQIPPDLDKLEIYGVKSEDRIRGVES